MSPKSRWCQVTLFLAITAGVFCACFCVLSMANNYYVARYNLDLYTQDLQGWEACRKTEPSYYRANAEAIGSCLKNLDAARENFWVNLPTVQLVGLFVLAGLGGAAGGYLSAWAVVWFCVSAIGKFISWMGLCTRRKYTGHLESQTGLCQLEQPEPTRSKANLSKAGLSQQRNANKVSSGVSDTKAGPG